MVSPQLHVLDSIFGGYVLKRIHSNNSTKNNNTIIGVYACNAEGLVSLICGISFRYPLTPHQQSCNWIRCQGNNHGEGSEVCVAEFIQTVFFKGSSVVHIYKFPV